MIDLGIHPSEWYCSESYPSKTLYVYHCVRPTLCLQKNSSLSLHILFHWPMPWGDLDNSEHQWFCIPCFALITSVEFDPLGESPYSSTHHTFQPLCSSHSLALFIIWTYCKLPFFHLQLKKSFLCHIFRSISKRRCNLILDWRYMMMWISIDSSFMFSP